MVSRSGWQQLKTHNDEHNITEHTLYQNSHIDLYVRTCSKGVKVNADLPLCMCCTLSLMHLVRMLARAANDLYLMFSLSYYEGTFGE